MSDTVHLVNQPYIRKCIVGAGVHSRNDLPGTSPAVLNL